MDFKNQHIVIPGRSRGIGAQVARILAHQGAILSILYRSDSKSVHELIRSLGDAVSVLAFECDIRDRVQVDAAFRDIFADMGAIDALVNNAGIWLPTPIQETDPEVRDLILDVNLRGLMNCCESVLPFLKKSEASIVNISSTAGQRGESGYSAYAASKGAVISYTKSLAAELGVRNIRVNAVAPGWVYTDMAREAIDQRRDQILAEIPLNRVAEPKDIAEPVCFLLSKGARFITGEILNVNGGSVLCG